MEKAAKKQKMIFGMNRSVFMKKYGIFIVLLIASGKGADGNLYCTYVMVYDGFIITTYGAIAADEFDYDSYGALYTLYFQVIDMLMG